MPAHLRLRRSLAVPGVAVALAVALTAAATGGTYRVRPGDTLSAIAARYHTTVAELVRLNHLPGNGNLIFAGSTLRLPGHGAGHASTATRTTIYVVRPGDSLDAIAARFRVSPARVARRNHLPSSLVVVIGQRLRITRRVRVTSGFAGHAVPSRAAVESMIRSSARHWGVDERLALGVSYEESGFNQAVISRAGAVGAMQVLPGTASWMGQVVVGRTLNPYVAQDNVTAGVALLSVLLRETRGNARLAVAGYYQGLASVQRHGMLRSTKHYVANVLALRNRF
jgi:LysM repeat protein